MRKHLFFFISILFFYSACKKENSSNYDCVNGNCTEVENGAFADLEACENFCASSMGYVCESGNCETSSNPHFSTLNECLNACSGTSTTYDCVNETCVEVSGSSGAFSSLSDCEYSCELGTTYYSCNNQTCVEDDFGNYEDLETCQHACNPAWIRDGILSIDGKTLNASTIACYNNNGQYEVSANFPDGNDSWYIEFVLANIPSDGTVITLDRHPNPPYGRTGYTHILGTITFYDNSNGRYRIELSNVSLEYASNIIGSNSFIQCIP